MSIPLEDLASDIIAKAQRGLGLSDSALAEKAGVSAGDLRAAKSGKDTPDVGVVSKIAGALALRAPIGSRKPRRCRKPSRISTRPSAVT